MTALEGLIFHISFFLTFFFVFDFICFNAVFLLASQNDGEVALGKEKLEEAKRVHAAEMKDANAAALNAQEDKYQKSKYTYTSPPMVNYGPVLLTNAEITSNK